MKHIAVQWMGVIAFMMINSSRQMDKQGQVSGKGVDENIEEHEVIELFGELLKHANDNSEVAVGVWRILQYYKAVEDKKPDNERIRYLEDEYMEALMSLALFFKVKLPESNLAKNDLTLDVLLQITHKARSVLEKDSEHTSASNKSTSSSSRGEGRRLREITEADGDKRQDVLSLPSTRLEETSASACRKNIKSSKERKGGKENWRH
ncbi:unnamed protein product [Albugo candida]|uniref:Uncharacterized protein n=1 Tax=Albugo candida TaxID=65357 RepID=A0A024GUJ6_9STRA|nr:unnamed protein product [Albugo candida]|eukprot:CCI50441.1 unnamed protein product [Albugo candida]